ncbi:MAG TPA: hypothetical protein VLT32_17425 [Candidatus Sulfomarinibacteraceae bacterium]|nr:hypothetical protein [Candidatus Sulfomarinibacteraceae bacterium]
MTVGPLGARFSWLGVLEGILVRQISSSNLVGSTGLDRWLSVKP